MYTHIYVYIYIERERDIVCIHRDLLPVVPAKTAVPKLAVHLALLPPLVELLGFI